MHCASNATACVRLYNYIICNTESRNGIVRHESVMQLRNKLEELGKMKGVNQDEKGILVDCWMFIIYNNYVYWDLVTIQILKNF